MNRASKSSFSLFSVLFLLAFLWMKGSSPSPEHQESVEPGTKHARKQDPSPALSLENSQNSATPVPTATEEAHAIDEQTTQRPSPPVEPSPFLHQKAEAVHYTAPGARERGSFKSRRYRRPQSRRYTAEALKAPPLVWSDFPRDGRSEVLPEELPDTHTLQARRATWNAAVLEDLIEGRRGRILLPTVEGPVQEATLTESKTRSEFTHTLLGKLDDEEMSDVLIVVHDGIVYGSVANYAENRHWEFNTLDEEHMLVRELNPESYIAPCGTHDHENLMDPLGLIPDPQAEHIQRLAAEPLAPSEEETSSEGDVEAEPTPGYFSIDCVVGYGKEAREAESGSSVAQETANMEARILASVDRMNLAFANSLVADAEVLLLGTIEDPDYDFPGTHAGDMGGSTNPDELNDLDNASSGNPSLNTVSDFAQDLGADFKSFVVKQADGSAGLAYRPGTAQITARDYMTSTRITWVHETGHNIGSKHGWGDSSGGNSGYNHGWRYRDPDDNNKKYRTVMAYDWGWTRTPYFANPDVARFNDVRTGAADGADINNTDPMAGHVYGDTTDDRFASGGYQGSYGAGFDGSNPDLGARNADYIEERASNRASVSTRTNLGILSPGLGDELDKNTTVNIIYSGVDAVGNDANEQDLVTLDLWKSDTGFIENIVTDLEHLSGHYNWLVSPGVDNGTDYFIRMTLNGSTSVDSAEFSITVLAPSVISQSPLSTTLQNSVSSLLLIFDREIDTSTFSTADLRSFTGPQGSNLLGEITGSSWANGNTELTISFNEQTAEGIYVLSLGPELQDTDDRGMNQDRDSNLSEDWEDRYAASFRIISTPIGTTTFWSDLAGADDSLDAGWSLGSGWESGVPTEEGGGGGSGGVGGGGGDGAGPDAPYDGTIIVGQNLDGDYANNTTAYAVSPVIDCSNHTEVELVYQRWLALGPGDTASLEAWDGSAWQNVLSLSFEFNDGNWFESTLDVSAYADGNPNFQLRWQIVEAGNAGVASGWHLDALRLQGVQTPASPPPPVVSSHSPSGNSIFGESELHLQFSQPMDTQSFDLSDLASFTGPSGSISPSGFDWLNETLLRISFSEVTDPGSYSLELSPSLTDAIGQALDQDKDLSPGETGDDVYVASFNIISNTAPFDIILSSSSILENQSTGSEVGMFSTLDTEGGAFSYSLVSGSGDSDNGSFSINGDRLISAESFNFELKNSYSIRVRSTDNGGLNVERSYSISILNEDEAPEITLLSPANPTVAIPSGVGLLLETSINDDGPNTLTWSKVSGPGTLTWDNTDQEDTGLTFSADGEYVLRITADDGNSSSSLDVTISIGGSISSGYQESGGLVVMEAESFDQSSTSNGSEWTVNTNLAGYTGTGLVTANPNTGTNVNTGYTGGGSPRLDYSVNFTATGTYYIWVRGRSNSGSDDSVHASLNDQVIATADRISVTNNGNWNWSRSTMDNANASLTVPSEGLHTFNLYMREDGASVDRILLTTDNGYSPSGNGPAVSPRGSQTGPDVEAGSLVDGITGISQSLAATVSDDGQPSPSPSLLWSQRSGSGTLSFGDATLADSSVSADAADSYVLRLQADDGEVKTFDELTWVVADPSPPDAPNSLLAAASTATAISLTWADNSSNEEGFLIERATSSGGPWSPVTTVAANTSSYEDASLAENIYYYQVTATNSSLGNSSPSNEDSASLLDSDNDGMIDEFEELAGSNPNDAGSQFELIRSDPSSGDVAFDAATANGSYYRVYYRDSLTEGTWQVLSGYENILGDGSPLHVEDSPPGTRFYRISVSPTPW